jgi:hypothetical protein
MNISERLHMHFFNAGLEVIVGCAITWTITHSLFWTLLAGGLVLYFAKRWSPRKGEES